MQTTKYWCKELVIMVLITLISIIPLPSGDGFPCRELISSPSLSKSSELIANSDESLTAIVSSPFSAST